MNWKALRSSAHSAGQPLHSHNARLSRNSNGFSVLRVGIHQRLTYETQHGKGVAMSGSSLINSFVFVWLSLKRSLGILLFRAVVNVCKKQQRLNVSAQAQDSEVHIFKIAILKGSVFNNIAIARNDANSCIFDACSGRKLMTAYVAKI